ncbi:cytochrome P450 [Dyella sp. BiH032]|uniref:cytochrome P450 n=1 Tax=Dyella sp. BiH032 TaxID=3075430 RepID=UPI0028937B2F|nr:cytochrome P450 [Dyella sp. BiH032]WNL44238.1 cytochrome P450 [Dyella sp. BiH032]
MNAIAMTDNEPPVAHGAVPLLGHVPKFARDPLGFLSALRDDGELVRLRLGPRPAYAACSPALLGELLSSDPETFIVGGPMWDALKALLGEGVATSNGALHRRQRRMIQPAFRREQVARYAPAMHEEAEAMAAGWQDGKPVDITGATFDLSVRVVARTLLRTDALAESAELGSALRTLFRGMYRQMLLSPLPLPRRLTRGNRAFRQALASLHGIVDQVIAQRRADAAGDDLVATLLAARDEATGQPLDHQEIHDHVISLLVGGTDSVAATMAWLLLHLAQHADVQQRIHDELCAARSTGPLDATRLRELPYLRNVVTESMRIQPAVWLFTRRASRAVVLGGYRIEAGADVFYSPYAMQRDPRSFDDPLCFDPDRWAPERAARIPRFAMEPFSAGDRRCPGDHFSLTELALMAIAVVSRWRLSPSEVDEHMRLGVTLRPRLLLLRPEARR